jgi:hypothetical protein
MVEFTVDRGELSALTTIGFRPFVWMFYWKMFKRRSIVKIQYNSSKNFCHKIIDNKSRQCDEPIWVIPLHQRVEEYKIFDSLGHGNKCKTSEEK